ncbi:MAG: hypothetical protein WBW37_01385 [Methyloceanibacter sp.]
MTVMAIDGAEITSDMPTARPKAFLAVGTLRGMLALAADLLLPPVCISCRNARAPTGFSAAAAGPRSISSLLHSA